MTVWADVSTSTTRYSLPLSDDLTPPAPSEAKPLQPRAGVLPVYPAVTIPPRATEQASPPRLTDSTMPQKSSPSLQAATVPFSLIFTNSPSATSAQAKVAAHWPIPS